ncbi:retrotransposon protein, putative, ty1-copia subclass [Tanacetum coccineum]
MGRIAVSYGVKFAKTKNNQVLLWSWNPNLKRMSAQQTICVVSSCMHIFLIGRLNRGIALVAIIDCQLPFEYTIASRSTDVMVWNAVYDAHNEVACLMLGSMTPELHGQAENSSPYEMLQELKSMFEKQAGVEHKSKGKDKSYIPKPKNPKPSSKEHLAKDDACHHCKEVGHCKRNCLAYLVELIKKKNQVGTASSSCIFTIELFSFLNKSWVYDTGCDRGGEYISQEFKDYLKACGIIQQLTPPYTSQHNGVSERRNRSLLDMDTQRKQWVTISTSHLKRKLLLRGCSKETMGYYFYFPPEKKFVVARNAMFLEKNLISQEVSGRAKELEEIQDEDTLSSENTSEIPMEVEGFEQPQEEVILVRRSVRIQRAPEHLCLNVEVEEHSLGDLNEPTNDKAAMLDSESNKWLNAMNAKMQSMKDNKVWCLVHLPHNAEGFTQTYGVDYEETFSPVADIRAIRILIAIAAFYDYKIWQMDVKTAFLNGYHDEDIYIE